MRVEFERYQKRAKVVLIAESDPDKAKIQEMKDLVGVEGPKDEIHLEFWLKEKGKT